MGWRRITDGKDYVEILFEFDQVRKFTLMNLYVNNYPSKGVEVRIIMVLL